MKHKISLSYILPVYNEAEIIAETIERFLGELDRLSDVIENYELIIVDDASTDGSLEIIKEYASDNEKIKLVKHSRNVGVGVGITNGIEAASMTWVSANCADRPFNIMDIRRLVALFEDNDMIVICRDSWTRDSLYRTLTSWVNYFLIRMLFRVPVGDFQFVQFYRASRVKANRMISRGTMVPPEMIIRMYKEKCVIAEAWMPLYKRNLGKAKYGNPKHVIRALYEMCRLRLDLWFHRSVRRSSMVKSEVGDMYDEV